MQVHAKYLLIFLSLLAFAGAILDLLIRLAPLEQHAYLYNADLLFTPALFADLARGGNLSDWRFPNALYIFPDNLLFALVWLTTPSIFVAIVVYGALQLTLLVGGFAWLAIRSTGSLLAGACALICGAAFCALIGRVRPTYDMAIANGFHVGILVVFPVALIVMSDLLLAEPGCRRRWLGGLLVLLTGLIVTSDLLSLIQMVLPIALCCVMLAMRRIIPRRAAVGVVMLLGLAAAVGVAVDRILLIYHGQIAPRASVDQADHALRVFARQLPQMLYPWPWMGLAILVFISGALWVLLRAFHTPGAVSRSEVPRLLNLGSLLGGFLITITTQILTN
ncbi:MAG: hypothetical protein HGA19_19600 [Oscillochloris sp.]|nr:hypothetical protein [Oscillochloris sp.]